MVLQCFLLLVFLVSSIYGHTEFIYTTKNEVKLFCDTSKWQISTESDSRIDVNCTVKCVPGEQLKLNNIQKFCTNEELDKVEEKCPLIATSGFFRCVTALDSGFLYPFAPSPNTVTSYIVATANELITNKSVERSSVVLTEDAESLIRLCVTLPIILGVPIAVMVMNLWKKNKTSQISQTMELRTIQHREEFLI
ncbi:uncharacterized protein LOC113636765 isoform X3 [Tachysurus fulvidraco]|uniref:uncharacterized protein LOC113636765 isoform X3 n=1 Tax=Tachysurus fulvidraco TaxID=1234273 RepID=UPI000F4FC5FA|nr:uncharacterized protein LOC113636765 isoform X3 [Tachysurus fulvidraco]